MRVLAALTMSHDGDLRGPAIGGLAMATGAVPRAEPLALVDESLGNSSYLVDLGDGRALAIDPERDPGPYLAAAERRGLTIAYAAETHLHADFVSGSRELAAHGAEVLAPAAGGTGFGHRGLRDGDEPGLGGLRLRVLATPATRRSTWPSCCSTATGRPRCSPAGRCWSGRWPGPT
jgi:glyoxylase-like metal-dependent hydrolase (beta-lactamase superfamily II)